MNRHVAHKLAITTFLMAAGGTVGGIAEAHLANWHDGQLAERANYCLRQEPAVKAVDQLMKYCLEANNNTPGATVRDPFRLGQSVDDVTYYAQTHTTNSRTTVFLEVAPGILMGAVVGSLASEFVVG
jgi:hypothetical protein